MFKRKKRRSTNPLFVIFRLILSLAIFAALLGGIFSAYKHFSGVDPLKLSPKSVSEITFGLLSQQKLFQNLQDKLSRNVLGQSRKPEEKIPGSTPNSNIIPDKQGEKTKTPKFVFRFALFADSHNDSTNLKKALDQIKKTYADTKFIIGLGDYTDVGTLDELKATKVLLDGSGFRYFLTPGDHDLWDSRNRSLAPTADFTSVFGPAYQSFTEENFKFIILDNSDNYIGLGNTQKQWLTDQLNLNKSNFGTFVFLHAPLFHPSSDHFMGRVEPNLKIEAQNLIKQLSNYKVKKVFAGDTHYFSEYEEPETKLPMVTIGAVVLERNLQNPRFAEVWVFDDGSTKVEDVEMK